MIFSNQNDLLGKYNHKHNHKRYNTMSWEWSEEIAREILKGPSAGPWLPFFQRKDIQEILNKITNQICEESFNRPIYPSPENVWRALWLPPANIKAVILGQDPYHNPGSATGLCFSIPPGQPLNPSLQNIYTELEKEGYSPNKTGNLVHLFDQGVLLLNVGLTVIQGQPKSHLNFWLPFTSLLIQYICDITKDQPVAWILLGSDAIYYSKYVHSPKHRVFVASHPSPLSAHKSSSKAPAFMGSNIFRNVNDYLVSQSLSPIIF
jgi:uracil-DNA glycosylase